jgi:hypothetical protein
VFVGDHVPTGHAEVVQNAVRQDGHVVDPPIRANEGWGMELMSGDARNITRVSNWEIESNELNRRDRRVCGQFRNGLDHLLITNMRHFRIKAPELDRRAPPGQKRINQDSGGWSRIKDATTYIDRDGWRNEYDAEVRAARARSGKYLSAVKPYNQQSYRVTTNDIMQVIVHSNKGRCRRMAQVNSHAGIKVPWWIGCQHGRSIKSVGPTRTSLVLADQGNFGTIGMVGQVTHKTNYAAMVGILAMGLRNDATGSWGRASIMADPFGPNDSRKNLTIQREKGQCSRRRWHGGVVARNWLSTTTPAHGS